MSPQRVEVPLAPPRGYSVFIGAGLLPTLGERCAELFGGKRAALITDSHVAPLWAAPALESLQNAGVAAELIEIPAGEKSKSLAQAEAVADQMIAAGHDRGSFIVALGGGVVGDLAGFVAAIYFRGIPYVQVPTTIIAQVDSAIGGKTGVNARGGKNLLGAFHQPRAVLADVATLRTLPAREFHQGFAEIIKHAVIRDAQMFNDLLNIDRHDLAPLIARNVAIKAALVAADEHEQTGERALLNFGHTIGHAIENAAGYGRFLHGEAIALGLAAAADLSVRHAGLPRADYEQILARLAHFQLPTRLPADLGTDAILTALRTDKKFAAGAIRFVLSPAIGSAFVSDRITAADLRAAVENLR